jgi:Asp-tRNA(Asn)/Glu-tRNA(Gln) amidotransferase A subunit family amidase
MEKLSPLYGIPISIKDMVVQKGHDATCGVINFSSKPHQQDGLIIQQLR